MKTRFWAFPGNGNISSATRVQSPTEVGTGAGKLKNDSEDDACGCSWSPELQQEAVGCSINFLKKQGMHPKNARWYFFCSISSSIWFHGHPYWGKQYWSEHSFRKIKKKKRSFYSVVDVNCSSWLKTSCLNYYVILGTAVESSQCSIKTIVFQLIHKPNGKPGFKLKAPSIFRASSQFEREETFLD